MPVLFLSFFCSYLMFDFLVFLVVRATATANMMPNGEDDQQGEQSTCDFNDVLFSVNRGFYTDLEICF